MLKKTGLSLLILLSLVGLPSKAFGHAVETNYLLFSDIGKNADSRLDTKTAQTGQRLELQSTFSTGEPLEGAEVSVYAPNNLTEPWLVGTTDAEGKFSFVPDPSIEGDWEIAIIEEGHEDYLTVPVGKEGIEYDLISQSGNKDVHYGSISPNPWGILGIAAVGATAIWMSRRSANSQDKA